MTKFSFIYLMLILIVVSCNKEPKNADLIVVNATIWTGDTSLHMAEAMAIRKDKIIAIGNEKDVRDYTGESTKVVDVDGAFITPGFIDSHVHLLMGGNALLSVQLRDAATKQEFIQRIADYAKQCLPGEWILEGNWDHTLWGGELPSKEWIDQYTPDTPVVLFRMDGHMVLANSKALEIAGIDENMPQVLNGTIVKDEQGKPTGILKSNAMDLVLSKVPELTENKKEAAIKAAIQYFLKNGVTSVHDVDSLGGFSTAARLRDSGDLKLRMYTANPLNRWEQNQDSLVKRDILLKDGLVKGFVDGSLGSHTAAFKEPYTDKSEDKGFFINSKENLHQWIQDADAKKQHITVHAIGDNAIYSLLQIYDTVISKNGPRDRRFRMEHVQHIDPNDIKQLSDLGIIASVQPYHAIDDGRWASEYIGPERIQSAYAFASLLDADVIVVFGSDWPVAPGAPLQGIYAATTRRTIDGKNPEGWIPKEKITIVQALTGYTRDAAYASFDENIKGTLEVGKLADFVVLSENLLTIDPAKIKDVRVLQTYLGGKNVFDHREE